jgi:PAS domain S-box-containing protein
MTGTRTEIQSKAQTAGRPELPSATSDAILEAIPDMLFCIDRDGRYLQFKPAKGMAPVLPPEEFLGRTMREVLPERVAEEGLEVIHRALTSGATQTYDYRLLEEDGERRYEARIVPFGPDEVLAIVRGLETTNTNSRANRRYALTKRELAVLQAVAAGHTDKEVARRLEISPLTVRKHVASIRKKMGAQSRTEASVRALKDGLLT